MKNGVKIVAFTGAGARLAQRICSGLEQGEAYAVPRYCTGETLPLEEPVGMWAARWFDSAEALVFVGAAGIAVRAVGPLAKSKGTDPAVICVDETGRFVIPLLSGHIGGGNRLAEIIAGITGGMAVLTTATDVNGVFSPDAWAAAQGCAVARLAQIKIISAALLEGEAVGLESEFPIEGALPAGIRRESGLRCGIYIGLEEKHPFEETLWLIPRCIRLGIGCRKGTPPEVLEKFVLAALAEKAIPLQAVQAVGTIDLKAQELALRLFCEKHRIPFKTYTAQELAGVQGSSASSSFVQAVTGVNNVCERAALVQGGQLLLEKTAGCGVTVAAAKTDWRASFCSC